MKTNSYLLLLAATLISVSTFSREIKRSSQEFRPLPEKRSQYTKADWQVIIDTTWGEGDPTEKKLELFDYLWNQLDALYPCFQNLDIDWDAFRDQYRPEIAGGVSHGRFVAIIDVMVRQMQETHMVIQNNVVPHTPPTPGIPLLCLGKFVNNGHFGASLTPLEDSTLLVYKAFPDHPLGLVPGDLVLGYEGVLWKTLAYDLLDAELPVNYGMMGSSAAAWNHIILGSAGLNWHLFDTIDIVKYDSGDTLHLPTSLLEGMHGRISGSDQPGVPGVDFWQTEGMNITPIDIKPNFHWFDEDASVPYVSWGVLDNTHIGYIYLTSLTENSAWNLAGKVNAALNTLIDEYQVDGLIFDLRQNKGGSWGTIDEALSRLDNTSYTTVDFHKRCNSSDHFEMCFWALQWGVDAGKHTLIVRNDPLTYYDKPIALLSGPGCISGCDEYLPKFDHHPMARIFGKASGGAFSVGGTFTPIGAFPDWRLLIPQANTTPSGDTLNYLAHTEYEIDEEIWLDRDSVARGVDNIAYKAVDWIHSKVYPYGSEFTLGYIPPASDITPNVHLQNPNDHTVSLWTYLKDVETKEILDSLELPLDDSNRFAAQFTLSGEERSYSVSYKSKDQDTGEEQILPDINKFTTKGPVTVDSYEVTSYTGKAGLRLYLANQGGNTPVNNLMIEARRIENCGSVSSQPYFLSIVEAGDVVELGSRFTIWKQDCDNPSIMPVKVTIYENNIPYWVDTISVDLSSVGLQTAGDAPSVSITSYPNPFRNSVNFRVRITEPQHVRLTLYNQSGYEVAHLRDEFLENGFHELTLDAAYLPEGIYFYRLLSNDKEYTGKLIKIY